MAFDWSDHVLVFAFGQRLHCIRKVALRLMSAVGFLRSQNVIHADLKPDNLRLLKGTLLYAVHAVHGFTFSIIFYLKLFSLAKMMVCFLSITKGIAY